VATSSLISINDKTASLAAYNIDSFNYFLLRDIGKAFNFNVGWDAASSTNTIDTNKGYTEQKSFRHLPNPQVFGFWTGQNDKAC
jgi:hypothetical protein